MTIQIHCQRFRKIVGPVFLTHLETLWQKPGNVFQPYSLYRSSLEPTFSYIQGGSMRWQDFNKIAAAYPFILLHLIDEGDDGRVARAADLEEPDRLRFRVRSVVHPLPAPDRRLLRLRLVQLPRR